VTRTRFLCGFWVVAALQACSPGSPAGGNPVPKDTPAAGSSQSRSSAPAQECALADPDARTALETLQRLGMVTTCQEQRAGVLRLELGPGWSRPPAEHHLNHLFNGYSQQVGADRKPVIELWKRGQKVGQYTIDGLVYGTERTPPQ
jgi:hypothetical protein